MTSPPIEPSEYLLQQFDAIVEFEVRVRELNKGPGPHAVKTWYRQGQTPILMTYGFLTLCQDLEKAVPMDHHYWHNMLGA